MNRSSQLYDLTTVTAIEWGVEVILASEPNRNWQKRDNHFKIMDPHITLQEQGCGPNFTCIKIQGLSIYSLCTSGNDDIEVLEKYLLSSKVQLMAIEKANDNNAGRQKRRGFNRMYGNK